jgi:uncharacterized protein YndB with AHSA1/START domain
MSAAETSFRVEPDQLVTVLTRHFDAPPELVFETYSDPQMIRKWWGPGDLSTVLVAMEVRMGGVGRFVQHDAAGTEFAFHGVCHEVSPPSRLVQTFEHEGDPTQVILETITFGVDGDGTKLTTSSVFSSVADRDTMVAAGMERGARQSMDRLASLLGSPRR